MELKLNEIQEIYDKAHAILEVLGAWDDRNLDRRFYRGHRLDISAADNSKMLSIYFDDRENSRKDYFSCCLNVSSDGSIHSFSRPHLTEEEAGEGARREDYSLSWELWLDRAYAECLPFLNQSGNY